MDDIIQIKNGLYTAKINLSRGASCVSFRHEGYKASILREWAANKEYHPYLFGMPILFPVNRISGGRFEFEGRVYDFGINEPETGCHLHGIVHDKKFTLEDVGEDFVICRLDVMPRRGFEHRMSVRVAYELNDKGLLISLQVSNLSDAKLPVMLGYHTTFNVEFTSNTLAENVRVYAKVSDLIERNTSTFLPTGKLMPLDNITEIINKGEFCPYGNSISRHYKACGKGEIELRDLQNGLAIVYENDEQLAYRLFYNGNGDEYICLEPQTCMVNAPNVSQDGKKTGFDFVEPHGAKIYRSRIYIKDRLSQTRD